MIRSEIVVTILGTVVLLVLSIVTILVTEPNCNKIDLSKPVKLYDNSLQVERWKE